MTGFVTADYYFANFKYPPLDPVHRRVFVFWRGHLVRSFMNRQQAAQYFVVGWVKNWSLQTYADLLSDSGRIALEDVVNAHDWLPDHASWWPKANRSQPIRRFMVDAYPLTNGRLWEASDNIARLRVAVEIAKLDRFGGACGQIGVAATLMNRRADAGQKLLKIQYERENYRRLNGHHWQVVK